MSVAVQDVIAEDKFVDLIRLEGRCEGAGRGEVEHQWPRFDGQAHRAEQRDVRVRRGQHAQLARGDLSAVDLAGQDLGHARCELVRHLPLPIRARERVVLQQDALDQDRTDADDRERLVRRSIQGRVGDLQLHVEHLVADLLCGDRVGERALVGRHRGRGSARAFVLEVPDPP